MTTNSGFNNYILANCKVYIERVNVQIEKLYYELHTGAIKTPYILIVPEVGYMPSELIKFVISGVDYKVFKYINYYGPKSGPWEIRLANPLYVE